jgi:iron complex transport system permease protein
VTVVESRTRTAAAGLAAGQLTRSAGLVGVVVLLAVAAIASVAIGSTHVPPGEVVQALVDPQATDEHVIVRELRGPRTVVGIAVGFALGVTGALLQGMTRNPLADPGILGFEHGAAFAVVIAIFLLGISSIAGYVWFALLGAAVAGAVVYALGAAGGSRAAPVNLALAGAAVAALLSSLTSAMLVIDARTLDEFRFWIAGSLAGRDLELLAGALPVLAVGLLLASGSARALNAQALGEDVARALGRRVERDRAITAAGSVLLSGAAVAVAGPIGFVGLTVPHAARAIAGPDYRWVLPYSALLGAVLVLVADVVGRVIAPPGEVQVGIVMALIGVPAFVALVRRGKLAEL